jgi:hypothetical protein
LERKRLRGLLETYTSVAVLLVAIAALSSFAINYFIEKPATVLSAGLERGMVLESIPSVDYQSSKHTLLIALNTNCSYCRESLPFYRKLALANDLSGKPLRILAVFPNKTDEVAHYARENDLLLDTVAEVELNRLRISGTPSMVLINRNGEVNDFWIGKLQDSETERLISALTSIY